jgi:hypothetical protein
MQALSDYAIKTWILASFAFIPLSVVVAIIQRVRKKEWWDAPWPFMMALMVLWIVGAVSGLVAAVLNMFGVSSSHLF